MHTAIVAGSSYTFGMPDLIAALLAAIPLGYLLVACLPAGRGSAHWKLARLLSGAAVFMALGFAVLLAASKPVVISGLNVLSFGELGALTVSLRADALSAVMLLLVTFIGWVIVGFSHTYLAGEPNQTRYVRTLMLTLALVCIVIVTNNLLMLALAWLGTSLALHQLLTFYRDRPAAQIAAHKKFLVSRVADACLFTALVLIARTLGTFEINEILVQIQALPELPASLHAAAVLIVMTALLKCAQLPLHGWLIQVMEAPTPVSALLHAGVVNLGGFVLIRLSIFISEVPAAQALLVVVGALTACIAALVMMTRISIKVMLAWSTCAQMGFMLMQCGLGAYELALLHLVAHSLYKAHAFLGAGGAVAQSRLQQLSAPRRPVSLTMNIIAAGIGALVVAAAAFVWNIELTQSFQWFPLMVLSMITCMALAPLLSSRAASAGGWQPVAFIVSAFAVAMAYIGLHHLFAHFVVLPVASVANWTVIFVLVSFSLLFILQSLIHARPDGAIVQRLYPLFYHGLYLDELFTRLTFRVWPLKNRANNGWGMTKQSLKAAP